MPLRARFQPTFCLLAPAVLAAKPFLLHAASLLLSVQLLIVEGVAPSHLLSVVVFLAILAPVLCVGCCGRRTCKCTVAKMEKREKEKKVKVVRRNFLLVYWWPRSGRTAG
jgi:hypothetical protein